MTNLCKEFDKFLSENDERFKKLSKENQFYINSIGYGVKYYDLNRRIEKAIESLNYYIEGMNESIEIWNKVKENEKIEVDTLLQMLEREKQNYIDLLDILKGEDEE